MIFLELEFCCGILKLTNIKVQIIKLIQVSLENINDNDTKVTSKVYS